MTSERTKQCSFLHTLFGILHFLLLFGPFFYFIPYGYITGTTTTSVGLTLSIVISLILAVFSIMADARYRGGLHKTMMWIMVLGVIFCLKEVEVFIWILAIAAIIDELIIVRLKDYYKAALISNKEIDKREKHINE